MIVFINGAPGVSKREVARCLAARFDRGVLADEVDVTMIAAAVERAKQEGVNVIAAAFFADPGVLARARQEVTPLDDVTYAFCISSAQQAEATTTIIDSGIDHGDMGYPIDATGCAPAQTAQKIWDDLHEQVEVVAPDPQWAKAYAFERSTISAAVGQRLTAIHHIGSTAVPELPAKPVIDIMATVPKLADATGCLRSLRDIGHIFCDYPQNTDRRFFRKGSPRTHHLHVVAEGSQSLADHLTFRDALRDNAELRQQYAELKSRLAGQHRSDRASYSAAKTAFIAQVLGRAPR